MVLTDKTIGNAMVNNKRKDILCERVIAHSYYPTNYQALIGLRLESCHGADQLLEVAHRE